MSRLYRARSISRPADDEDRGWTGGQNYNDVIRQCVAQNEQWVDPEFPPDSKSVFYSTHRDFVWKRPHEICNDPQLFVDGASRFDVKQGMLGDCWLLAATASLSLHKKLLQRVIPGGQHIGDTSPGVVKFNFWQFGEWVEVLVDTLLPTYNGQLVFLHSDEKNEFWSALLEKAYAKLYGSYESLKGGSSSEAAEDFTGGVTENFDFRKEIPPNMFEILEKANSRSSLMGCSIEATPGVTEDKLANGLIKGHAYSITGIRKIEHRGQEVKLIRVRNPWGNEAEWRGPWSDRSAEMASLDDSERDDLGVTIDDDGEFWMEFDDFTHNFQRVEVCNLGPDSLEEDEEDGKQTWEAVKQLSRWQVHTSAGGCRNFIETFALNPQFHVRVVDGDDDDDHGTLIVGLMQKGMRQKRAKGVGLRTIGYVIYEFEEGYGDTLPREFFERHVSKAKSPQFINLREICGRHKLKPGQYVIVPSTFEPNEQADFLLRIFSEKPVKSSELDVKTKMVVKQPTPQEPDQVSRIRDTFSAIAGRDGEIDASELQNLLNNAFEKKFPFDGFCRETSRSLIAMMDMNQTGKLDFDEFIALWTDLMYWTKHFTKFDVDRSGTLDCHELRSCLSKLGFSLSSRTLRAMMVRFAGRDGRVEFDDFVLLAARLKTLLETFQHMDKDKDKYIHFTLDDFIMTSMYY